MAGTANGARGSKVPASAAVSAQLEERTRGQTAPGDLHYWFAPLKHSRLDYMAQKAVEMGAARLQPVITRHTQAARVNLDRMRANAVEAAEQCGILTLPGDRHRRPIWNRRSQGASRSGCWFFATRTRK